jgi:sulfoxide reductase heme-binding subunit YedZ
MRYVRFDKFILLCNGLVPLGMLCWDGWHKNLGANPVENVLHTTGLLALIFLALTLSVTPLRKLTGWNYLSHFRRMLGLFAFFYALCHFTTYFFFYHRPSLVLLLQDIAKRPFILLGITALLAMLPLAVTSTNRMIKRLGAARWKKLHQLVYLAAVAGVWHYYMFPKSDHRKPFIFVGVFGVLLGYRIVKDRMRDQRSGPGFPVTSVGSTRAD